MLLIHDPRDRMKGGAVFEEPGFESNVGGLAGGSPNAVNLPVEHEEIPSAPQKIRPYGAESYVSFGFVLPYYWQKVLVDTRAEIGFVSSVSNQPDLHQAGGADSESIEPHTDDSQRHGWLVLQRQLGKRSTSFTVPTLELSKTFIFSNTEAKKQKLALCFGTRSQTMRVWNFPVVTAKTDSIYFHTNHTPVGVCVDYVDIRPSWDFSLALSFRHAKDGDLGLFQADGSTQFFGNWWASAFLYAGVKQQKFVPEVEHHGEPPEEEIEQRLGLMTAYGGSFIVKSPAFRQRWSFRTGFAAGSLHAQDSGLSSVTQNFEAMPRHHYLITTFFELKRQLDLGSLISKSAWYGGAQNYVTDPGDPSIVKKLNSYENILQWEFEREKARGGRLHALNMRLGIAYLFNHQRAFESNGNTLLGVDHLFLGLFEIHFSASGYLRKADRKEVPFHFHREEDEENHQHEKPSMHDDHDRHDHEPHPHQSHSKNQGAIYENPSNHVDGIRHVHF